MTAGAWEIVERFARELPRCEKCFRHKLTLDAVRDSLQADAVYWYPGGSRDAVELAGARELPSDWCVSFTRKLLESTPGLDGRLVRSALPPPTPGTPRLPGGLHPCSAALVRVSRSQSSWLVALSFNESRRFQATDLQIMALVRRVYVNQRRCFDLVGRMTDTLASLVQCLTSSIDAHLPHTHGHSDRVAKFAVALGKRMRLPASVLNDLYFAGLVHDIGITAIPQSLLLEPRRLTAEELAEVKAYPVIGDRLLAGIKQLAHLRPAVRHHHERYDGAGYPDGLAGEDIPLMARILGVADSFDAMRSPRPHRPALALEEVDDVLAQGAGQQWDPCVVEHYLRGRPHFQLFRDPAGLAEGPALQYVMPDGWNADSSEHVFSR